MGRSSFWPFYSSFNSCSIISRKNKLIVVEQGEKLRTNETFEDEYGLDLIKNAAYNKKSIAIVITNRKLTGADFYLQCLDFTEIKIGKEEKKANLCMLQVEEYNLGYVNLLAKENKALEKIREETKEEFLKDIVEVIFENIEETTKELLEEILIPEPILFSKSKKELRKEENAIIPFRMIVLGGQGAGKTTFAEIFHQILCDYYKEEHVHAIQHDFNLTHLLQHGFSENKEHFVNMLVAQDFTYQKASLFDLQKYIRLRHTMKEKTGLQQGLVVSILNLHQLTGVGSETGYRKFIDLFVLLQKPSDKWTIDYFKQIIPEAYLEFLAEIDKKRKEAKKRGEKELFNKLKGYGIAVGRGFVLPFYLNTLHYPAKEIKKLELPDKPKEPVSSWEDWEKEIIKKASKELAENYEPFGYKNIIPKLDADICEGFLLEKYQKVGNLGVKRRRDLAIEVFAKTKFYAWLARHTNESVLEAKWPKEWEEYAATILLQLSEEQDCPKGAIIEAMIDDLELERYGEIRAPSYKGVNYRKKIKDRIIKAFHTRARDDTADDELGWSIPESIDEENFKVLQKEFMKFYQSEKPYINKGLGLSRELSRIATLLTCGKKRVNKVTGRIIDNPKAVVLKNINLSDIHAQEWDCSYSSLANGSAEYKKRFGEERNIGLEKFNKDKHLSEEIGENYAYRVLMRELKAHLGDENLNSLRLVRQSLDRFHDFFLFENKDSKPYDLALFTLEEFLKDPSSRQALVIFNHKLLRTKSFSSEKDFGSGANHPGLKVLWKTSPLPFKEKISLVEGLGFQNKVEKEREISMEELMHMIKELLEKKLVVEVEAK